jgi:pimeloyl-ACP methyl ester carboxylesterase
MTRRDGVGVGYGVMNVTDLIVDLGDGRSLDVALAGPADGSVVVLHHGTPASGRPIAPFVEAASARGIRLVSYSRPGYAGSSRLEGRSIADCVADVVAIVDHLGVDRFATMGWSGGGPHTLACAALLPERVTACATVAGVGPWGAEGLDFLEGMAPENHEEFGAALESVDALRTYLEPEAAQLADVTGADVAASLGGLVSDVDKAAATGEFAEYLAATFHDAVRDGIWGWFDDDIAFTRPWGFDLSVIRVPVWVWQGAQDLMVPFAHGEWLAGRIPDSRPMLRPEHGHLSLAVTAFGEILDDLMTVSGV